MTKLGTQTLLDEPTDTRIDQLHEDLAAAKNRVERAEASLGRRAFEGKSTAAAEKEIEAATAEVRRLTLMIDAAVKAGDEAATKEADQVASDRRRAAYEWAVDYVTALDGLDAARRALGKAEAAVADRFAGCPRSDLLSRGLERYIDPDPDIGRRDRAFHETDLDPVLLSIPVPGAFQPYPRDLKWDGGSSRDIVERLKDLVDAERQGATAAAPDEVA